MTQQHVIMAIIFGIIIIIMIIIIITIIIIVIFTSTDGCIEQAVVRLFFRLETLQVLGFRV